MCVEPKQELGQLRQTLELVGEACDLRFAKARRNPRLRRPICPTNPAPEGFMELLREVCFMELLREIFERE